eukprot:Seg518.8 transcript_id=Seg518.8/GoldUCD/mRNA.D3Y31 product="5'-AMP-activated protein kinase catalytic subunit alpha-2" protein_id=Seg518.8/GoldUCD/D3Y31
MKRANMDFIKEHEWFKVDLPAYLFPSLDRDGNSLDEEAINEICEKFQVEESDVRMALATGDMHDQLLVAYHLILDNRRINAEAKMTPGFIPPPTRERAGSVPTSPNGSKTGITPRRRATMMASGGGGQKGSPRRPKWHLGIRSQSRPQDIMAEVYRAMLQLGYEWKIINPFSVRVRARNKSTNRWVKIHLQLYQVDNKSYLLDFKSLASDEENFSSGRSSGPSSGRSSPRSSVSSTAPLEIQAGNYSKARLDSSAHHIMEFYEMSSDLIVALAC